MRPLLCFLHSRHSNILFSTVDVFAVPQDGRLSLVHEVKSQVNANFTRAERLRQSVLQRGFAGGLATATVPD
jgi:hypothetical protein